MGIPVSQMLAVARYVVKQRVMKRDRYPLVLMLEPLFRCNLSCTGCGKIQYPTSLLKQHVSAKDCLAASDECGAPVVSIAGGEPLLHPQITEIVAGLIERDRYIYLCTNALLLKQKLDAFTPDKHLSFSVHMDGPRAQHNFSVCRDGVYDIAVEAIREAVRRGFRVTTNTTLFEGADPERMRGFFDDMMALGVEGMMISPGYSYQKAPDQEHFLRRERSQRLFSKMLASPNKAWRFNQSPLFLQFLMGKRDFECTPWGNPTYNLFGWQRPCYLLQDGYAKTFRELMEDTEWSNYGRASKNPRCQDCMVHCGFEPSAVDATFRSARAMGATVASMVTGQL
ncbi:MAG TPA: adenosyl-hopene transferase HpnH [Kofleriaceae bacterium]|jgi:hopanoid biosynthesis associated radical SAM protein HpnH|nr:adenosyl-hopene transferase HpnH [Kofleriaceae bacterium]